MDEIEIAPYDPAWPGRFTEEVARLTSALDPRLIVRIAHFGSTAIPGMAAKPIIDMLLLTPSLETAKAELIAPLRELDYVYWAENPKTDRMFFVRGMPPYGVKRMHHLHIVEPGSAMEGQLAFVDWMRGHPGDARAYEALKRDLAWRHRDDRDAYTAAKADFIAAIMKMATG